MRTFSSRVLWSVAEKISFVPLTYEVADSMLNDNSVNYPLAIASLLVSSLIETHNFNMDRIDILAEERARVAKLSENNI